MNRRERHWVLPENRGAEDRRNPLRPLIPLADLAKLIGIGFGLVFAVAVVGDVWLAHDNGQSETSLLSQLIEKQNKTSNDMTTKIDEIQETVEVLTTQQKAIRASQRQIETSEREIRKSLDALSASKPSDSAATSHPHV